MKPKRLSAPLGASLVVLSSVFYASYGIWTRHMGDFFDGYTATALRSLIIVVILLPVAVLYRQFKPLNLKANWLYIVGLFVGSLFSWGPYYYAILHAGIGISLAVEYASIVIGMFFFGWLFGKEHFTRAKALSAVLGLIGLVLIFTPSTSTIGWLALSGAVVSGICSALNMVLTKHIHYPPLQTTIILWTCAAVANMVVAFALQRHYPAFKGQVQWLYLLIFALASIVASWSFVRGVKLIDAGAAGVLGLLEIVFGVIFGALLFHEHPTAIVLLGMGVIIAAAAIPYFKAFNARRGTLD